MKIFTVVINKRYHDSEFVPFFSKEKAINWVEKRVQNRYSQKSIFANLRDFGGDLEKGEFYSEDEEVYITEKEVIE